ncbi:MAG: HU family DNA-binding protein [Paludibacteraceae bacterium]|nr:HU family DNA-binding protein [Paludibacteraceae bacterium]
MNKGELVAAVAAKAQMTKADAAKAVDAAMDVVIEALQKGENVQMIGFGTFAVTKRAARKGVNPATGKAIEIPAKNVVKFKAGAKMAL